MSYDFSSLFTGGRRIHVEPGAALFRSGDKVTSMFFVLEGKLRLVRNLKDGNRMILHEILPGHVAAEASAYVPTYHCDGEAGAGLICLSIPLEEFHRKMMEVPDAASQWMAYLAHGTQSARMQAQIRNLKTVRERLDAWLETGNHLPVKGEWQSVADTLGVTREALYRELARRK